MQIINRFIKLLAISTIMLFSVIGILNAYEVGGKITFGSYPFYEDGRKKPIDWIILDIDADNNALVISDYVLDNVKYNEKYEKITWENSTIRKWLNNDFLNKAFSPEQRSKIISSRIVNKDNAKYNTRGGNATTDKLFLLSIEEAEKYFKDDESRIAYPTPYAKSKKSVNGNLYVSSSYVSTDRGGSCWWWLRSPGDDQDGAADVYNDGDVLSYGNYVNNDNYAVRVAFKINLKNLPKAGSLTDTSMEKNYYDKKNTQKVELLALRKGFHRDRTRVVFDISDACVWEEMGNFSDALIIKIKGASSKIPDRPVKIGHEVKKVSISTATEGYASIRVDKKKLGSEAKVQLLDSPSYKLVIDVFKLNASGESEDLNKYDEILSKEEKQNPEGNITEADRQDAAKAIKALQLQKQPAGKKIIVIDPGHSVGIKI